MRPTRYFIGLPCPKGHICERMIVNRDCIMCMRERSDKRYEENKVYRDKTLLRLKSRYDDNPQKFKDRSKNNYAKNPDPWRARTRLWAQQNPERNRAIHKAKKARRRATEKLADGKHTWKDVLAIFSLQKGMCVCGADLNIGYHLDHMTPLSRGGSNDPTNLQLLCAPCNSSKGAKTMSEWLGRL